MNSAELQKNKDTEDTEPKWTFWNSFEKSETVAWGEHKWTGRGRRNKWFCFLWWAQTNDHRAGAGSKCFCDPRGRVTGFSGYIQYLSSAVTKYTGIRLLDDNPHFVSETLIVVRKKILKAFLLFLWSIFCRNVSRNAAGRDICRLYKHSSFYFKVSLK